MRFVIGTESVPCKVPAADRSLALQLPGAHGRTAVATCRAEPREMVTMDALRQLIRYHYRATARCIGAAQTVEHLLHSPLDCGHGSVFATLAHMVGTDLLWSLRCREGICLNTIPDQNDFPSLDSMRDTLLEQRQAMLAFLLVLSPPDLERRIAYQSTDGLPRSNTLHEILLHMTHHAAFHRGELAMLLRLLGGKGNVDQFMRHLRKNPD